MSASAAAIGSAGRSLRSAWPVVLGGVGFVATWQAVVWVSGLPPYILPEPLAVLGRFLGAWTDGTLARHTGVTLVEILLGFAVGAASGLAAGAVLARSRLAGLVFSPYLVAAQSTPILALAPLLALWFPGTSAQVIVCALIVFFPIAVSTMVGLRGVDRRLIELGRSLRMTRRRLFISIEVPAALPTIFGGIRVGVTLAVVGAIIGEWAGAGAGLGYLLNIARGSTFDTPLLFATLLTIALLGVAFYGLAVLVERRLVGVRG